MKFFIFFLLFIALTVTSCDKSEVEKTEQTPMPVTNAVKAGDWMVTYFENNASLDMGLTFLTFNIAGSLVAIKDGIPFNGSWKETNTGSHTLSINITTSDPKLQKANRTWKVAGVSVDFIDLKDSNAAVQLMKH